MITSKDNSGLKLVRKLARGGQRDRSGLFVAEGEDLLAAADEAGWTATARFCAAGSGLAGEEVDPQLLASVSALGSGSRAIGVFEARWGRPAGPLCVYLDGVGDPGNVGAVLRSALAFAASCVALGPGCADPFGPKAVRASMGAVFRVPVTRCAPDELPGDRIALAAGEGEPLRGPLAGDTTVMVGAEREGLSVAARAAAGRVAHIPIASESLNAAMAATVALYELTRITAP